MFNGKDRIILTELFNSCDNGKKIPDKESSIRICNFLGIEENAYSETPKSVWNMENSETEGRNLMRVKQIFRVISDKIDFLVCPENPNFHLQDVNMQETKVSNTVK